MLTDERKWENFQKIVSWILLGCAVGFLVVITGLKLSNDNALFKSAFFISGMVIFGVTMALLLMIAVVLVILDVRELGAAKALFQAGKAFFVYLGVAVLLVLMMYLLQGKGFRKEIVREIFLFAVAMDIGSYLGRFSKRRLPRL
jgi:hypothetical protein